MNKPIKIGLALLLLSCLADWPYGYYQFVRFAAAASFVYLGITYAKSEKQSITIIYFLLAILFQPFIKISLGRALWNAVDIIIALGLMYSVFTDSNQHDE